MVKFIEKLAGTNEEDINCTIILDRNLVKALMEDITKSRFVLPMGKTVLYLKSLHPTRMVAYHEVKRG